MLLKRTFSVATTTVALSLSSTAMAAADGLDSSAAHALTAGVSSGSSEEEQYASIMAIVAILGLGIIDAMTVVLHNLSQIGRD